MTKNKNKKKLKTQLGFDIKVNERKLEKKKVALDYRVCSLAKLVFGKQQSTSLIQKTITQTAKAIYY